MSNFDVEIAVKLRLGAKFTHTCQQYAFVALTSIHRGVTSKDAREVTSGALVTAQSNNAGQPSFVLPTFLYHMK